MAELLNKESAISDTFQHLNSKLKIIFSSIYDEFEDHLDSINENSSEIQSNYEFICKVDNKIAKLNERIDKIHIILSKLTGKKTLKKPKFEDIDPLTKKEKNIFLNIYTEEKPITYSDLAKKINMPVLIVREYITRLMEKGVPIQKTYKNIRPYISLNKKFKNLQAKKNILKIEQKILI